jgi:PAS domain S-box-containing protein
MTRRDVHPKRPSEAEGLLQARIHELERAVESRVIEEIRELTVAVENAMTGISKLNKAGLFIKVHRGYAQMLGYDPGELVGRSWEVSVPPEDHWIGKAAWQEMVRDGRSEAELRARRKDGSTFLKRLLLVKTFDEHGVHNGHYCFMRDVTREREAEERLRRSEAGLAAAQHLARIGSFEQELGDDGDATWSAELFRILGYDPSTTKPGLSAFMERVHPHDRAAVRRHFHDRSQADTPPRFEHRLLLADGEVKHVSTRLEARQTAEQGGSRLIGTVQDISDRKSADARHRALEEQLRQSQKMEALGKLASGVAHDFNNVLTVILGSTDALTGLVGLNPESINHVSHINQAARKAAALTRQLLAFSRKEVARLEVVDPVSVIDEMKTLLQRLIGEHIEIEFDMPAAAGRVTTDPIQLQQAVLNLALNAADAMPKGGRLTIAVQNVLSRDRVSRGDSTPTWVTLSVTDTGIGMSPEIRDRIFEPFFTTKESGRGTGLGLSTVYGTVKQMGGRIRVDSTPGEGSRFTICLPVAEDADASSADERPSRVLGGDEIVLVCEDDVMVRTVTEKMLSRAGYTVVVAENGRQALELAGHRDEPFDLVISDVVMPEMSGPDLVEAMLAKYPDLRALLVSGYTPEKTAGHGGTVEGVGFLHKPYRSEDLLRRVRDILDEPRASRQRELGGASTP